MNDLLQKEAQELFASRTNIFIFTGAGMSVPLGTKPYWTGVETSYGGEETIYGLTALEHAHAIYWNQYEEEQLMYFRDLYKGLVNLKTAQGTHYHKLLEALEGKEYFNITSNIDNAFINYGFNPDNLYEIHGNTRLSQCIRNPNFHSIFPTTDPFKGTATCPSCGSPARPAALFFDDYLFNDTLESEQYEKYLAWRKVATQNPEDSLILEIGAGVTITTIRQLGMRTHGIYDIPFIRINPNPYPTLESKNAERNIPRSKKASFITLELTADEGIDVLAP